MVVAALTLAIPYAGSLATAFGFVPLPAQLFATILAIVAGYIVITEFAKARFYRTSSAQNASGPRSQI